jgi:hypothetical protein
MSPNEQMLWNKVNAFQMDEADSSFSFSDRLARENGWTKNYALRVVDEYKKFLFLCCVTDQGVTPSDAVDQAWHLHLTYTKSYWVELCSNTLGIELHHNPTKGGKKEAGKFDTFYTHTIALYQDKFRAEPPRDIWQDNHDRFTDIYFQRINLKHFWLIKKPSLRLKSYLPLLGIFAFAPLFIQASFGVSSYIFLGLLIVFGFIVYKKRGSGGNNPRCSTTGCGSGGVHNSHHSDSGCGSGCSGCSGSSGCSGCGGGGD